MLQKINEQIAVIARFFPSHKVFPVKIYWRNQEYRINRLAYYHQYHQGKTIQHIFHVTDGNLDFRLRLNSDDLSWTLEEVDDGNTD